MNIEIASRLYEYRRKNNLSQEELAEKIGVSRQAVSKWERAEASPDTDNLILLARLYGVSLDELLSTDGPVGGEPESDSAETSGEEQKGDPREQVHVGWDGIHVHDGKSEVHVSRHGVFVKENDEVKFDSNDPCCKDKKHVFGREKDFWDYFPIWALAIVAYLCLGLFLNMWHPGWLVFFIIPIYYSMVSAFRNFSWHRFFTRFPLPVILAGVYLAIGFLCDIWHPTWAMFLLIPVYYGVIDAVHKARQRKDGRIEAEFTEEDAEE